MKTDRQGKLTEPSEILRREIRINGIVQGVGFRPFLYRLARREKLAGFVRNDPRGVVVEVEGRSESLDSFLESLETEAPPLAEILEVRVRDLEVVGDSRFQILESRKGEGVRTLVSPDIATCPDCLRELQDPEDRRFRYPFINCTNCGPRYTIVESIPYDRENTSMRSFQMCRLCANEYSSPEDRRFHAQPNACSECGPHLRLADARGDPIQTDDPISESSDLLRLGKILAVRGLGGFHLVVDAMQEEAVSRLRRKKGREAKPFAMMASSVERIREFCIVRPDEAALLESPARPIVLLEARSGQDLGSSLAPGNLFLGFMLPYTPLHHLLLEDFDALVMTSANYSDEPIVTGNREAVERLGGIADFFLFHNREILQRCDDSVARTVAERPRLLRRSRGYVPSPLSLQRKTKASILACGGELKNTVALSFRDRVFSSQHIGDLEDPRAFEFFQSTIDHLQGILEIKPEVVVCDQHPQYLSSQWARRYGLPVIEVQHHHAHLASLLAEKRVEGPIIGVTLDGTGYGSDGTIWGGEVLVGDPASFERVAYLEPFPLPGGEAAVRQPWRTAISLLDRTFKEEAQDLDLDFWGEVSVEERRVIRQMIRRGLNAPMTSSCGRLFDGISALMGVRREIHYEAQAAVELEMLAHGHGSRAPSYDLSSPDMGRLDWTGIVRGVVEDLIRGEESPLISARFHASVAEIFRQAARCVRDRMGIERVGLSGGVFQNIYLLKLLSGLLTEDGFEVLSHERVPPGDGGLALGQVVVADARLRAEKWRNGEV